MNTFIEAQQLFFFLMFHVLSNDRPLIQKPGARWSGNGHGKRERRVGNELDNISIIIMKFY